MTTLQEMVKTKTNILSFSKTLKLLNTYVNYEIGYRDTTVIVN